MDPVLLIQIAGPLLAIGGAWGGAKVALNGTKERVKEIKSEAAAYALASTVRADSIREELVRHTIADEKVQRDLLDRAARIETKLDMLMENKNGRSK